MATLVYSPAIQIIIGSRKHGLIDVSEDCSRGQVTLSENAVHSLSFDLLNQNRKYDQVFTPNDRVVLRMKRIRMLPVFAGYLNAVPFFSAYPQTVHLTASCTLKRLQYTFWDPGTAQSAALLNIGGLTAGIGDSGVVEQEDAGISDKVKELLTTIVGWETANIHIGAVPRNWFDKVSRLMDQVSNRINFMATQVGTTATVAGSNVTQDGTTSVEGVGPGTGQLRDTSGIATYYHTYGKNDAGSGPGSLGNKNDLGMWYCAISGPWANRDGSSYLTPAQARASRDWWKGRRLLVTCTTTNKSIVVGVADFEAASSLPGSHDHVIDLDTNAFQALGVPLSRGGAPVEIRFAPDHDPAKGTPYGPYSGPTPASSPTPVKGADHVGSTQPAGTSSGVGTAGGVKVDDFLALALAQKGKKYDNGGARTWGADVANPPSFDCSGLVHWLLLRLGVNGASGYDTSDVQYNISKRAGLEISVPQAIKTKGALVFRNGANTGQSTVKVAGGHVAISLGDGRTIAASSPSTGVTIGKLRTRQDDPQWGYDVAALAPGIDYTGATDGTLPNAGDPSGGPGSLISNVNLAVPDDYSAWFGGARALINDEPVWGTIRDLMNASMRSFCSAPNGDFIGWFPDYFGMYGTAATMVIRDIELRQEFSVYWDDSRLITHEFTAGAPTGGVGSAIPGGQVTQEAKLLTAGIATVDFPEIMAALFNIDPADDTVFKDAATILDRFGARPNFDAMPVINLPQAEFWSAIRLFQKNWAEQFSATVPLTFMPEIFPGMLLRIESMKLQVYVEEVTHAWDFSDGGGFTTTCRTIAPAATDNSGLKGLLRAGSPVVPIVTVGTDGGIGGGGGNAGKRK